METQNEQAFDYIGMIPGGKEWKERNPDYKPNNNPEETLKKKMEAYNALTGDLPMYDCPECKNKGRIAYIDGDSIRLRRCKCMTKRSNAKKLDMAGLSGLVQRCRFCTYQRDEPFQSGMYATALDYASDPKGWLFMSGAPGSGKTHLCVAACNQIITEHADMSFRYMKWVDESKQLKASVNEKEDYERQIDPLKRCDLLYIDDFLKCRRGETPTTGDINLAFEIINARLIQSDKLTVISSEWSLREIIEFDEALGSRIWEAAGMHKWYTERGKNTNYRLRETR